MKLLTIAIPTYNRCNHLKKTLKTLVNQVKQFDDIIDILISDNNSNDSTEQLSKNYCSQYDFIRYNRNKKNLGMDGNFVFCFENSISKYTWLLGDDDALVDSSISLIIDIIVKYNPGLIHLNKQKNHDRGSNYQIFHNKSNFLNKINFWITFISSNIVKTEFVKTVDFKKYMNSYFTLVPVYLNSVKCSESNVFINKMLLMDPLDQKGNGGYNIFKVFSINYLKILKEYKRDFGFFWYEFAKYILFKKFLSNWIRRLIRDKVKGLRFSIDNWFIYLFKNYWYEPYFYLMFFKIFILRK